MLTSIMKETDQRPEKPKGHWTVQAQSVSTVLFQRPTPWKHLEIFLAVTTHHGLLLESQKTHSCFSLDRYERLLVPALKLKNFGNLKTLTLVRATISTKASIALGMGLATNQTIQTLNFANCHFESDTNSCAMVGLVGSNFLSNSVRFLSMTQCFAASDGQLTYLAQALVKEQQRQDSMLEVVDLSCNWCPHQAVEELAIFLLSEPPPPRNNNQAIVPCDRKLNLKLSNLYGNGRCREIMGISRLFHGLQSNTTVRSLNLDGVWLSDDHLDVLALALRHNNTLKELSLLPTQEYRGLMTTSYGMRGLTSLVSALQVNFSLERLDVELACPQENNCIALIRSLHNSLQSYLILNRCGRRLVLRGGSENYSLDSVTASCTGSNTTRPKSEFDDVPSSLWPHILGQVSRQASKSNPWGAREIQANVMYFFLRERVLLEIK